MNTQVKNPVVVKAIYDTKDSETKQILLSQVVEREITSSNALLSLTMGGHESFKTGSETTRTCFHNFSTAAIEKFGLVEGAVLPEDWNATLVVREYVAGEVLDLESKKFITNKATHFVPWKNLDGTKVQEPKRQGQDGGILTSKGQEIYRNTYLSVKGMPTTDKFIEHDGVKEVEPTVANTAASEITNVKLD